MLTGKWRWVEIVHHSNVLNPVYFTVEDTAVIPTVDGNDCEVLLPGERIRCQVPYAKKDTYVSLISGGTAKVTVVGVR